jgi:hypothetical protein
MICSPFDPDALRAIFELFIVHNKDERYNSLAKLSREIGVSYQMLHRFLKKGRGASQDNMAKMIRFLDQVSLSKN